MHAISRPTTPVMRKPLISNGVLGMFIFVFTEIMFFSAFISAYLIIRSNESVWPPWGQPRLPIATTGFNTAVLIISGFLLVMAGRSFSNPDKEKKTKILFGLAIITGAFFVVFQGYEWANLINYGLTFKSSLYGSLFYLIIGLHALHVVIAIIAMIYTYSRFISSTKGQVSSTEFNTIQVLWLFVVGVWPILYVLVYLI